MRKVNGFGAKINIVQSHERNTLNKDGMIQHKFYNLVLRNILVLKKSPEIQKHPLQKPLESSKDALS